MAKVNTNLEGYSLQETGKQVEDILQSVDSKADNSTVTALSNKVAQKADKSELPTIDTTLSKASGNPIANKTVTNTIEDISDGTTVITPNLGSGTQCCGNDISDGLELLADISKFNGSYHLPEITVSNGFNIDNGDIWLTPSKYSGYSALAGIASDLYTLKNSGISITDAEKAQLIAEIKQAVIADLGTNVVYYEDTDIEIDDIE